jgi:hypothetical protein
MMNDLGSSLPVPVPVHKCVGCGGIFRREAFEGRMHLTGIFTCPSCGTEGPLNLEIYDPTERGPD